jgi:hypothetical protein
MRDAHLGSALGSYQVGEGSTDRLPHPPNVGSLDRLARPFGPRACARRGGPKPRRHGRSCDSSVASLGLPVRSAPVSLGRSHDRANGARSPVIQGVGRVRAKTSAPLVRGVAAKRRVSPAVGPSSSGYASAPAPPRRLFAHVPECGEATIEEVVYAASCLAALIGNNYLEAAEVAEEPAGRDRGCRCGSFCAIRSVNSSVWGKEIRFRPGGRVGDRGRPVQTARRADVFASACSPAVVVSGSLRSSSSRQHRSRYSGRPGLRRRRRRPPSSNARCQRRHHASDPLARPRGSSAPRRRRNRSTTSPSCTPTRVSLPQRLHPPLPRLATSVWLRGRCAARAAGSLRNVSAGSADWSVLRAGRMNRLRRPTARSPAEWRGFVVSAILLYRKRTTRSR